MLSEMIFDLMTIKNANAAFDFSLEQSKIDLDDEAVKLKAVVRVLGKIRKSIVQTDVEGNITTDVEVECVRCLQPVNLSLDVPFNAAFVTAENYTQAAEAEIKEQDLDVSIFEGDQIDLTELVREQILLALPEQVFCREDCKGLCQKCSANRNLIDCTCEEKEVDPRWAALKNLK
jgi:uncharacterized protein